MSYFDYLWLQKMMVIGSHGWGGQIILKTLVNGKIGKVKKFPEPLNNGYPDRCLKSYWVNMIPIPPPPPPDEKYG